MLKLVILNVILIAIIVAILVVLKKFVKNPKTINLLFLIAAILTIASHYSSLLYHAIKDNTAFNYLCSNPNLILPIYPCNLVMWLCLVYGCLKNKETKFANFLTDYIFFFGIISCLVGMFANVDFIKNPTLLNYDITKSIVAHGFMLFNVLLFGVFNKVKYNCITNTINIFISIIMMLLVGLYCNLLIKVFSGESYSYTVNSMFILHSPFDGISWLKYPVIAGIAFVLYFGIFNIIELFKYPKGDRWWSRITKYFKVKHNTQNTTEEIDEKKGN